METAEINVLDVTRIEPKLKHPTIFQHFDALKEGEAFLIHNDHDPKPLYYQLLGERGDIFVWEYQEQGPQWWKVRISKKKLSTGEDAIGTIAAKDLRKAEVFRKYGLDFCCGGAQSLDEACKQAGVPVEKINAELEALPLQPAAPDKDFNNWGLDFLTDYIVNIHHKYVTNSIPILSGLSHKITEHHGLAHPVLYEIQQHVSALLAEMQSHQIKEEKILFPFIKQMVQCKKEGRPFAHPPFGTIESPVQMMLEDHQDAAAHLHAIESLSHGYEVPEDGCQSYRLYYQKLKEFDDDLHQHIHLENNILFPKAVTLEKELNNK